jgi:hypothetical protein
MKNDFVSLYKVLEPAEQDDFRSYIQAFYKEQRIILDVFDQVVLSIANKQEDRFNVSIAKNKKIQNDLSDLKKWLLEFLTIEEVRSNSLDAQLLTIQALRKRHLKGVMAQKSKSLAKTLAEHTSPDMWMMYRKLRLAHIHYFDSEIDPLLDYQAELHHILNELDSFYFSAKLKYTAELHSRAYILQENYQPRLMNEILSLIETDDALEPAIKNLYFPLYNLVEEKSEATYETLKTFLAQNKTHEKIERLSVLIYLLNFAINRMRQGDSDFQNEYIELTEIGMSQSLFIAAGYISTEVFTNAVNVASHLQKHEWAKRFIQNWSKHLEPKDQVVTVNLSLARVNFEQKNYDEVITLLQQISNKNIAFNLNGRVLLARAYYEQNQRQELQLHNCDAVYLYVTRSTVIGSDLKKSILNFIKILRSLNKTKTKKQLTDELNNIEGPILCQDWLKAKIEERKR